MPILNFNEFWRSILRIDSRFEKRVLSIDYGTQNIGFCLSDGNKLNTAKSFTLTNDQYLQENIKNILLKSSVVGTVVGFPIQLKGFSDSMSLNQKRIINFSESLSKLIPLTVFDESYSSYIARRQENRSSTIHAEAARQILNSFLKAYRNQDNFL